VKHPLKAKGKRLDTCYSATYMSQTRDQQRFTISEVAADWHEPMVPQHPHPSIICPKKRHPFYFWSNSVKKFANFNNF